jgi:hypothetical protein
MKKIATFGLIAFVSIGTTALYTARRVVATGSVTLKPFTATVREVKFLPNGSQGHEETYTVAFRTDGSNVTDYHHLLSNGETTHVKVVEDMQIGHRIAVDYATESTSTYPLPTNYATIMEKEASRCTVGIVSKGESPIFLGYQVVLVHAGTIYKNGASNVRDRWEAPALNCFPLRRFDSRTGKPGEAAPHNEVQVTNIVLGEPDATLFSIPQNFVERSPSERHAEFQRRYGMSAPTPPQVDEVYNSGRQMLR